MYQSLSTIRIIILSSWRFHIVSLENLMRTKVAHESNDALLWRIVKKKMCSLTKKNIINRRWTLALLLFVKVAHAVYVRMVYLQTIQEYYAFESLKDNEMHAICAMTLFQMHTNMHLSIVSIIKLP